MHDYRTHTCAALTASTAGSQVRLSGWIHRKRDHGQLLFVDLRDHYGMTQCVVSSDSQWFDVLSQIKLESVVTVTGTVVVRSPETVNTRLATGEIEVRVDQLTIQSRADQVPLQVNAEADTAEDIRLKYRFLDLRREKVHSNIVLRSNIISSLRRRMIEQGFTEFQTPILTASSPEGARDFLVPSRLHPGKFYALPQAPQQFKQLLMVAGFDRYFQIAPCFRDEDSRADRSPGEFYQLDFEMSFVTQEDVFNTIEPVLRGMFEEFAGWNGKQRVVSASPFPRIPYDVSMLKYGNDKPDLRNPLVIADVGSVFQREDVEFRAFRSIVDAGGVVRAIRVPNIADRPRSFYDKLNDWARELGAPGLGYIIREAGAGKGPIAKFVAGEAFAELSRLTGLEDGDAVFFVCDQPAAAAKLAGIARTKIAAELELIDKNRFEFCWIVDFPMFELNEDTGKIDFSHNPFSMPQGGLEALETQDPLTIKAFQYDIVCNGIELSSGAIRNHLPEVMLKAFGIAGYEAAEVEARFSGMLNAFRYGAPPHGGSAPGIDRMVMLLADEPNIREVIAFPMNQKAEDLMMGAPSEVRPIQLKELAIRLDVKAEKRLAENNSPLPLERPTGKAGRVRGVSDFPHPNPLPKGEGTFELEIGDCLKTLIRTLCLLFLISTAGNAHAADPAPASHKAIYKMGMVSAKSTSIVSVAGEMYYDFTDSCDAWASDQKFSLNYVYADEPEAKMNSQYTSHEAKNGTSYDFAVNRSKNGAPQEEFVGSAARKPDGSGVATFTQPVKTIDLPKAFLFPTQHTSEMIRHARAGDRFFSAMLFDGSDGTGATEVNVVIGDVIKPQVNDKLADNPLLQSPARKVRLAFFPVDTGTGSSTEAQPDYEMSMILHENGVVSSMQIDYDQFSLKGELEAIETIKTPKC